ncbi:MAG: BlaI/MecI/CopY family transcriptional regulator [Planctomycetota bacterium]
MKRKKDLRLGDLQLAILQMLWELGEGTVTDVQEALATSHAYTTVATMLQKMEAKGLVSHRSEGRRFIYRASVEADAVTDSMVGDLVDRLFGGSVEAMLTHLLESKDVSTRELARLEKLIETRRKR